MESRERPTILAANNEWANIDIVKLLCVALDQRFSVDPILAERFPDSPAAGGDSASLITYVEDRAGHDWRYAINADKIERTLGFVPAETFETGIAKNT